MTDVASNVVPLFPPVPRSRNHPAGKGLPEVALGDQLEAIVDTLDSVATTVAKTGAPQRLVDFRATLEAAILTLRDTLATVDNALFEHGKTVVLVGGKPHQIKTEFSASSSSWTGASDLLAAVTKRTMESVAAGIETGRGEPLSLTEQILLTSGIRMFSDGMTEAYNLTGKSAPVKINGIRALGLKPDLFSEKTGGGRKVVKLVAVEQPKAVS